MICRALRKKSVGSAEKAEPTDEFCSSKCGREKKTASVTAAKACANYSSLLGAGILPVVKYCSISSSVRPFVSGRKNAAVMK